PWNCRGQIARTRPNPASQTIILALSQCSSVAESERLAALRLMPDIPQQSAKAALSGAAGA
ncbi:hypothetical protein, partial [Enterococcus faecium]